MLSITCMNTWCFQTWDRIDKLHSQRTFSKDCTKILLPFSDNIYNALKRLLIVFNFYWIVRFIRFPCFSAETSPWSRPYVIHFTYIVRGVGGVYSAATYCFYFSLYRFCWCDKKWFYSKASILLHTFFFCDSIRLTIDQMEKYNDKMDIELGDIGYSNPNR